jgi:dTDP-4-dehydrorhamnose 3,5-epimerase-like enzyme
MHQSAFEPRRVEFSHPIVGFRLVLQYLVQLDDESGCMFCIPESCGHGYLALAPNTDLVYQASVPYPPKSAAGVRHDHPAFNIVWPGLIKVISSLDHNWPSFSSGTTA